MTDTFELRLYSFAEVTPDPLTGVTITAAERLRRYLLQMSVGTMPHDKVLHAIELFGTKVAPIVRAEIGRRATASAGRSRRSECVP